MLEVCSQNSDIDFGYQLGDPNLSVKIGGFSCKISEVCSQNSDIDFGYQLGDPNLSIKIQLGDPNLSVKIGRFSCEISEEGYSRTLDGKNYVFV